MKRLRLIYGYFGDLCYPLEALVRVRSPKIGL